MVSSPAPTPALVAYYRVSTERQGRSGLGLEAQQYSVEQYARRVGKTIAEAYSEVESGRCRDRPHLAAALAKAKATGATLVVAKLDRLARDVALILKLVDTGVPILFLDLPELTADPIVGRLVLTVMAAIAEFEARRISQRCREAFARRKARGLVRHGGHGFRDKKNREKASAVEVAVRRRVVTEFRYRTRPVILGLKSEKRTLAETSAELNDRGIRTLRGKPWTVANLDAFLANRNFKEKGQTSQRSTAKAEVIKP